MDGSDLLGPGSATTKSTTPARYVKDLAPIDSKDHKAFRNLWHMTIGKIGKTTVNNASVRYIIYLSRIWAVFFLLLFSLKQC